MTTKVTIPDFDFATGMYYGPLRDALIRFKRRNVPELTDESKFEPFMNLLDAFALVGHLNATLLDLVANESTLPTAHLAETVRNMLRLIDYEMKSAAPSQADILFTLSKVFTAAFELVPARSQVATPQPQGEGNSVFFEVLEALLIQRTDQLTRVFAEDISAGSPFTEFTTPANAGTDWTPLASPAVGDSIYFGHDSVMWDELNVVTMPTPGANFQGVWEYYDGNFRKIEPALVTNLGTTLRFDLTSYLGTQNRAGTKIRVELNQTGAFQDVVSQWSGSANYCDTGFLGQSSPSTTEGDYTVGSDWEILSDASTTDGTSQLHQLGKLAYSLPQTAIRNWIKGLVDGIECFWLRFRFVSISAPTAPVLNRVRIDGGKQYGIALGTQGRTQSDSPLGSSTGLPNQSFQTTQDNFIDGSEIVTVDSEVWTRVKNFLASTPTDRHYQVKLGKNDRASIIFGDGVTGRIPPIGINNVEALYRFGANDNGNVGALTITVDKTGLTYVSAVKNPRAAVGWDEAQGANESSLERAKIEGPASLRTKDVALGPSDVEQLAVLFTDDAGARPYARVRAFEEGFGPKTIEAVVVANGGGQASPTQLRTLEEYFNGNLSSTPEKPKRIVANQMVFASNFSEKTIDIVAQVWGVDVSVDNIETRLNQIIQPDALKDDGVTFQWSFGGEVSTSRLVHEIFESDTKVTKVVLTTPAANVTLNARELPKIGTITIQLMGA